MTTLALLFLLAMRPTGTLSWEAFGQAWRYHVLSCPSNACPVTYVTVGGVIVPYPSGLRICSGSVETACWVRVGDLPASKRSFKAFCGYSYVVQAIKRGGVVGDNTEIVRCP